MLLYIDTETYSETPISVGTYKYAETAEVMLVSYAIDDAEPRVIDLTDPEQWESEDWRHLRHELEHGDSTIIAHNAMFDRNVLRLGNLAIETPIERWECTMVQAMCHALPASLDELGRVLGLPADAQKLRSGKALIRKFCQPTPKNYKVRRYTRETHPEDWARFMEYARQDIAAMRECRNRMPTYNWGPETIAEWHADQRMNDYGFRVDLDLVRAGAEMAERSKAHLLERFEALTDGLSPTQREACRRLLNERYGFELEGTAKHYLTPILENPDAPEEAREIASIMLEANKTSNSKYAALLSATSSDGRFRGGLQFAGASRTRRAAGRVFQPQNLPSRGLPPHDEIERYIEALKMGVADLMVENHMLYGSAALRGVVLPSKGKKLAVSDLSNIEGRGLAWLACEDWKLKAFADYDAGQGPDVYNLTAVSIIGGDPYEVPKADRNVFGKVPDLACIAEGSLVLTERGLIPIEKVPAGIRVWDGIEWVRQDGPVYQGEKEVIEYDGVTATPDHIVWTDSGRTCTLAEAAAYGERLATTGVGRQAVRLGSYYQPGISLYTREMGRALCRRALLFLRGRKVDELLQSVTRKISWLSKLLATAASPALVVEAAHCGKAPMHQPQGQGLPQLWRSGHRVQIREHNRSSALDPRQSRDTRPQSGVGSVGQRWALRAGEYPMVDPSGEQEPHETVHSCGKIPLHQNALSACTLRGQHSKEIGTASERSGDSGTVGTAKLQTKRRVWDLLNCGPRNRFTVSGRLVHNCGYGGGVSAFQTFAKGYGIRMEDHWPSIRQNLPARFISQAEENYASWGCKMGGPNRTEWVASEAVKLAWRARHPQTVLFWKRLQKAAESSIRNPGKTYKAGPHIRMGVREVGGHFYLFIALPSGRYLCYFEPEIDEEGSIRYWGMGDESGGGVRKWVKLHTYGGKIAENITQAFARDVLYAAHPAIEEAGFRLLLHVHDENITECAPNKSVDELSKIMATPPDWAPGLPLAAAGFEADRYRKD